MQRRRKQRNILALRSSELLKPLWLRSIGHRFRLFFRSSLPAFYVWLQLLLLIIMADFEKLNSGNLLQRLWQRAFPLGFTDELHRMLALAWPAILTTFFQLFLQTTSIIMSGHLSKEDLDGVALASSLINVIGITIGLGMSTACDTLFSQTFGSANKKRVGMYLQRSLMVIYCVMMMLWCLHLNIRPVLLWLQQEPEIAYRASQYMLYFLPGLFFDYTFLVLSRYLQNQNVMYPPMIAGFIGNLFNITGQYIALHVLNLGYLSSAVMQASSLGLMFLITLTYIIKSGIYKESWDGWKVEALYDWADFVKLAVPGIFLIALEHWSFEVATIIAGTLGAVQLGAQSVIFQIESISYMIPLGLSVAVNIRVGQQLGAKEPVGASQSHRVGVVIIFVTASIMAIVFACFKDLLPRIFTTDEEIIGMASDIVPVLGAFLLSDGISATSCGAIRGCGKQLQGAILLFVGYYLLALPIGIPLALATDLQVLGMWIGLLIGVTVEAVAFCVMVVRLNWPNEVILAQRRVLGRKKAPRVSREPTFGAAAESEDDGAESEHASLLPNKNSVAFYSEPESANVAFGAGGSKRRRHRRRRRGSDNFGIVCSGRFFSGSVTSLAREGGAQLGDVNEEEELELPPLRPVLIQRLVVLLLLVLLLACAAATRIYTESVLPPPSHEILNSTFAPAVTKVTAEFIH